MPGDGDAIFTPMPDEDLILRRRYKSRDVTFYWSDTRQQYMYVDDDTCLIQKAFITLGEIKNLPSAQNTKETILPPKEIYLMTNFNTVVKMVINYWRPEMKFCVSIRDRIKDSSILK